MNLNAWLPLRKGLSMPELTYTRSAKLILCTLLSIQTLPAQAQSENTQSKMTQLEVDLATKKLQLGNDHPEIMSMTKILNTLRQVEREKSQQPVTVFKLKNAKPTHAIEKIKLLFPSDAFTIVADERTSSLVVRGGSDEKMKEIEQLLDALDSEVQITSEGKKEAVPLPVVKMFTLQHIAVLEAQKIVADLFKKEVVSISMDQRTNSIVVRGQPEILAEIQQTLTKFDEKPREIVENLGKAPTQTIPAPGSTLPSTNELGSTIEAHRNRIRELEKPVLQLAEKLRASESSLGKDHADSIKQRADMRALVQQAFVARQEVQRAELIEFTRRLKGMQQAIDARDRIADKIVERRMEELLEPSLQWTQSETKSQSEINPQPDAKPLLTKPKIAPEPESVPITAIPQKQTFSYTLFEVSDPSFVQGKAGEPIQIEWPVDFNEQLATMLKKKTAKVLRRDEVKTTLDQESTLRVGEDFEVPSPTPRANLEPYTVIQITPRPDGYFAFSWNERSLGGRINQMGLNIKSPTPGSTGYIIALPVSGSDTGSRKFLHLFIRDSKALE
jgi:hypothetical protein